MDFDGCRRRADQDNPALDLLLTNFVAKMPAEEMNRSGWIMA
jgi:hypothetical protein